ncbi:hypothetical protein [Paracoccus sp. NSM]|uniref:hypothetical protein n=1 Tax=Paracoccus sp. NSM TaxID=3457784 RepID=UPI004036E079
MSPRDLCLDGDHRQSDAASLRLRVIEALDQGGLVLRADLPGQIDHGALQVLVSGACEARRRGLTLGIEPQLAKHLAPVMAKLGLPEPGTLFAPILQEGQ